MFHIATHGKDAGPLSAGISGQRPRRKPPLPVIGVGPANFIASGARLYPLSAMSRAIAGRGFRAGGLLEGPEGV
ncbi:MAG: hypothetical protein ACOC91_03225, partial [bacterium]